MNPKTLKRLNFCVWGIAAVVLFCLIILLAVPILDSLSTAPKIANYDDVSLKSISYTYTDNHASLSDDGRIQFGAQLIVFSKKDGLYFKVNDLPVYYLNHQTILSLKEGDNLVEGIGPIITVDSFSESPRLSLCFSYNYFSSESESGVICKEEIVRPPRIDISINPSVLYFEVNNTARQLGLNSGYTDCRSITVTNNGELALDIGLALPDISSTNPSTTAPYYNLCTASGPSPLGPGESAQFGLVPITCLPPNGDYILPGRYADTGFVYWTAGLSPGISEEKSIGWQELKKEISLETIVVE